ncbi:MAG: DNA polymerase IV [Clostridiales bacterium]|jgi:DNA polymerase-4|nr:DNA polymerase IV [Clostridiales bacterium]
MNKVIFHIDVNSAFLSWEAVDRLKKASSLSASDEVIDLRDIPSAVGGDINRRHGVILAKSFPAKQYGIRTGEPTVSALKKCPNLTIVPPNHKLYEECSEAFVKILEEYSPCIEKVSVDEAFCDMTGTEELFGPPLQAANTIKDRIFKELGFTVNIGISTNKLLAKMASDFTKPNRVHTLYPSEIKEKMWGLPVGELFFVGKATVNKLHTLGIYTIGQLANTDVNILKSHLKKHGEMIYNFANGIDSSLISNDEVKNKGYGNSTTIAFDVEDEATAKTVLLSLAENVSARLRKDGQMANVVAVGIVDNNFRRTTHQKTLLSPTHNTNDIYNVVCQLFDNLWEGEPIRKLEIQTSKVISEDEEKQLDIFSFQNDLKKKKLDKAIDQIRNRFGNDAIQRASLLHGETTDKKG